MKLVCANREVQTVFDLFGESENDMTFSLGWLLGNSAQFLQALLQDITGEKWANAENCIVRLQTGRVGYGITDVEIVLGSDLAIIFEAKRGPELPSIGQLELYARAISARVAAKKKILVALTNATAAYASVALVPNIEGVPVLHRSWRQIKDMAENSAPRENSTNKMWLRHFVSYVGRLLQMETQYSNWTYVVSLAIGNPDGWQISWIDIVEKRYRYFYPIIGGGWPDPPPNYVGFRYHGKLQRISHVESYEIIADPHDVFPEAPNDTWKHYCLTLGPPIRPSRDIPVGPGIKYAARVWCMIDTLLTAETITEALVKTKKRDKKAQP